MKLREETLITFDDVLLEPQYSEIESRSTVSIAAKLTDKITLGSPLIGANMDSISSVEMAVALHQHGGMCPIHRFMSIEEQVEAVETLARASCNPIAATIGVSGDWEERLVALTSVLVEDNEVIIASKQVWDSISRADKKNKKSKTKAVKAIFIDIAHANCSQMVKVLETCVKRYPDIDFIPGNVATVDAVLRLEDAGAAAIKIGIGGGCFVGDTRILMADGSYKNIKDIKLHDRVINKDGNPVEVVSVRFSGWKPVINYKNNLFYKKSFATKDHRHLVGDYSTIANINKCTMRKVLDKETKKGNSKYKWEELNNLDKHVLLLPRKINFEIPEDFTLSLDEFKLARRNFSKAVPNRVIPSTYDLGYIFGTFLGDGCASLVKSENSKGRRNTSGSNIWYFGADELDIANKVSKCLYNVFGFTSDIKQTVNLTKVINRNNSLTRLLLELGKKNNKHLPKKYIVSNKEYLKGIYDGLIDSDGVYCSDGRVSFYNTSPELIELFMFAFYNVNGYYPSMQEREPTIGGLLNCNIENCKKSYSARSVLNPEFNLVKDFQISKLYEVDKTDSGILVPTYDIEVGDDTHSFIANNAIVHNSICSTRLATGVGVPQLSAIMNCARLAKVPLIADGGITKVGDIVKALAAGASTVMIGHLIAGTKEAAGNIINVDGVKFKVYRGQACYSSDTDILTRTGWKNYANLSLEDEVATLNPLSNLLEYQNPSNIFKYNYSGSMVRIDSKYIDLCVTPNHRMYVAKRSRVADGYKRKFKFVEAKDMYGQTYIFKRNCKWEGKKDKYFYLPGNNKAILMNSWLKFFGFWLAEGCAYTYIQKKKYRVPVVEISNKNKALIEEMVNILNQAGIHCKYRYRKNKDIYELRCYNRVLYNYLSQFGKAPNKFIPIEIKNLSKKLLKPLLHYIFLGDGCASRNCIYTTSELLRDDIIEISMKCGMSPSFYTLKRADSYSKFPNPRTGKPLHHNYDLYAVNIGESFSEVLIKKERHSVQNYNGIVWCVEVPNGLVYVRRNNKTVWCGNSKDSQLDWKGGNPKYIFEEGVSSLVPYKGKVSDIIINAHNGIKSGLSYCGSRNLEELREKAVFQRVSQNTIIENNTRVRFGK